MSEDKRCPVGGVDRSDKADRISIQNAVETPFWMSVWAAEPERMIDVRMSYSDLKVICDLIDEIAGRLNIKLSVPENAMIPETYRRPLEQDVWDEADLIPESDWKQLLRDLKYTEVKDGEKMVVVSDDKKDAWEYENKYQRITLYDHLNGILWERNRQKTAS